MGKVLVLANETVGGRALIDAVQRRKDADPDVTFVLVVPRTRPRHGRVIYEEAVHDAAQVRVDLAVQYVRALGITGYGEVGDPDPFLAAQDAVAEHRPDEIIVSTKPETSSGWLRRDLPERIGDETGLPVEHVVTDVEGEGLAVDVTLVVANRTAAGDTLVSRLKEKVGAADEKPRLFIVVVPQDGGDGNAAAKARARLAGVLSKLRAEDLVCAGMIGDPDPFDATMNALQIFHVDEIVISTLPETRSGWLRQDLVQRVRKVSARPVEHVVSETAVASRS